MKYFFRRLKSVRLAVALIAYLTLTCVLATLVPQGAAPGKYHNLYPEFLADLILQTGFNRFFNSFLLFLFPAFLFFANLSACTVDRFIRELRKKSARRHGPDILHLGLMLLTIGSILSASLHSEKSLTLFPGSYITLPDESILRLETFHFERYPDGRPKNWTSVLNLIAPDGRVLKADYKLRVNSPLRYKGYTFYQASYSPYFILELRAPDASVTQLYQGRQISMDGASYSFMAPSMASGDTGGEALIRATEGSNTRIIRVSPGDRIGSLEVLEIKEESASVVQAVRDPGYLLVLPAMFIVALGTALTFIQKIKELV